MSAKPDREPTPFTLFSSRADAALVLRALRDAGARIDGLEPDDTGAWRSGEARWPGSAGAFLLRHDPSYYSGENWRRQVSGMFGYFLRAGAPLEVLEVIRSIRFSVSLTPTGAPLGEADPRFEGLAAVTRALDGVVFVPGGLRDADGAWIFRMDGYQDEHAAFPAQLEPNPMLVPQGGLYDPAHAGRLPAPAVRRRSCEKLTSAGFAPPWGLPQNPDAKLRPPLEIARRLFALRALFAWVAVPPMSPDAIEEAVRRDELQRALTEDERQILAMPRDEARQTWSDGIGWRLENMWSLAWVLGFEPRAPVAAGMVSDEVIQPLLTRFLPALEVPVSQWLSTVTPRDEATVLEEEDLFYCAHHAVRSAQLAQVTVPRHFHPVSDGGVIHERRHALTWCLSPGVEWDDTDLST